jgi:hypothetical protein
MASFEPRGLGIKKEMYSRKRYSGVPVSNRDNLTTGNGAVPALAGWWR